MKFLAVHADDFGLSEGTNEAIAELLQNGAISSTTIMANGGAFEHAMGLVAGIGGQWPVGLHGNLTQGRPIGGGEGLAPILDSNGCFRGRRTLWAACRRGLLTSDALHSEFAAQWARCVQFGLQPVHLDTHQHAHANPTVLAALVKLSVQNAVPFRRIRLDTRVGSITRRAKSWFLNRSSRAGESKAQAPALVGYELLSIFQADAKPTIDAYQKLLERSRSAYVELMVHPAKIDAQHRKLTDISQVSADDYACLSSPAWKTYLNESDRTLMAAHQLLAKAEADSMNV